MPISNHQYNLLKQQLQDGQAVVYDYGNSQITLDGSERQDCDGISFKGNFYRFDALSNPQIINQTSENASKGDEAIDANQIISQAVEQGLRAKGLVKDSQDPREKLTSWLER